MLKEINLQLFANDELEELDDIELEEEETEESEETEETEEIEAEADVEEPEPEEEPELEKPVKKDKKTAAIIREKQANKALRDKLAALEKEKADREQVEKDRQLRQRLIDNGYTEEEADDRVADRREREELKRTVRELKYNNQADKLASRYPSVYEHLDSFIGIVEASKGAITLAELCRAKLDESTASDIRTRAEQEVLLNKKKAKEKQITTGDVKTDAPVKLSANDEAILANINKKKKQQGLPLMSKKQFLELSM